MFDPRKFFAGPAGQGEVTPEMREAAQKAAQAAFGGSQPQPQSTMGGPELAQQITSSPAWGAAMGGPQGVSMPSFSGPRMPRPMNMGQMQQASDFAKQPGVSGPLDAIFQAIKLRS